MFKIKRTEDKNNNHFTISTNDGFIRIEGKSDFVVRMIKDICENSEEFLNILKENLQGKTIESVAEKMRSAGFPENIVTDFENGNLWDDLILRPTNDGR